MFSHAQTVTIVDRHGVTHKMVWDFHASEALFAYGKGISIYHHPDDGEMRRVGIAGWTPQSMLDRSGRGDETPEQALAKDFAEAFNKETKDLFDMPWEDGNPHPVDEAVFQYLLASVAYDPAQQKMTLL